MPAVPDAVHAVRRRLLIHRRGLAALCVAALTWSVLVALRPPAPPSATVWTAVRELPSGTVLQAADLRETHLPRDAAPRAAHDLASLTGRALASPLGTGEVATTTALMGNEHLAGYPGRSAVPLRIPDAETVALLRTGDRVDLVASDPQQPRHGTLVATDVVVLAVPHGAATGSAPALEGRLVVFAVPSGEVVEVAAAASGLFLNVVWNR